MPTHFVFTLKIIQTAASKARLAPNQVPFPGCLGGFKPPSFSTEFIRVYVRSRGIGREIIKGEKMGRREF